MEQQRKTMSVPEAGKIYYELSPNGSYQAAARGDIPTIRVGRLLRVPVQAMEKKLASAGDGAGRDPAGKKIEPVAA